MPRDVEEGDRCRQKFESKQSSKAKRIEHKPLFPRNPHFADPHEEVPSVQGEPILVRPGAYPTNPYARLVWCNQILCTWLANKIGLAVDSIRRYREPVSEYPQLPLGCLFQEGRNFTDGVWGIFVGALPYVEGGNKVYETLPRQWHTRIVNRNDHLGMLVFDLWMGSTRWRRAMYLRHGDAFRVVFVSHGSFFYGNEHDGAMAYHSCGHGIRDVIGTTPYRYEGCTRNEVDKWIDKIAALTDVEIEEALSFEIASLKPARYDDTVRRFLNARRETASINIDLICSAIDRSLVSLKVESGF